MIHLDPATLAAYVDRAAGGAARAQVEAHLAECTVCREEMLAVSQLVRASDRPRRLLRTLVPLAAAAALLLILVPAAVNRGGEPAHREPAVTASQAPAVAAPVGPVGEAKTVMWSLVLGADRYRVTLFDSAGRVLWEATTADTTLVIPAVLELRRDTPYFWRVRARTSFDRWTESNLVEFRIGGDH